MWLTVDYLTRIISLGMVAYALFKGMLHPSRLYLKPLPIMPLIGYTLLLTLPGVWMIHGIEVGLKELSDATKLATFPKITRPWAEYMDLSFGLMLVAVSEEIIFRSLFYDLFHKRLSTSGLVLASACFFALIHWGMGADTVIGAFAWAVLAMGVFIRIRSVYPLILGHFLVNLVLFSGVLG